MLNITVANSIVHRISLQFKAIMQGIVKLLRIEIISGLGLFLSTLITVLKNFKLVNDLVVHIVVLLFAWQDKVLIRERSISSKFVSS